MRAEKPFGWRALLAPAMGEVAGSAHQPLGARGERAAAHRETIPARNVSDPFDSDERELGPSNATKLTG